MAAKWFITLGVNNIGFEETFTTKSVLLNEEINVMIGFTLDGEPTILQAGDRIVFDHNMMTIALHRKEDGCVD